MSIESTQTAATEDQDELTIEELAQEVQEAKSEANSAKNLAKQAQQKLIDVRERELEKDQRITELEEQLDDAQSEIKSLRDRTGLLQTVKNGSSMKIDERAAVLIQTLYNEAWKKKQSSANNAKPKASMDYNAASGALGGSPDRSAIYRAMDKAEELVENEELCRKVEEDRGSDKNTRLVLNLEAGDVPTVIGGQTIINPAEVQT